MGAKGQPKTGGKVKGSHNKATDAARATLKRLGLDPFEEMIKVYQGKVLFEQPILIAGKAGKTEFMKAPASEQTRFRALSELLKRQYPELKAIEVSGLDGVELLPTAIRVYFGKKPE